MKCPICDESHNLSQCKKWRLRIAAHAGTAKAERVRTRLRHSDTARDTQSRFATSFSTDGIDAQDLADVRFGGTD